MWQRLYWMKQTWSLGLVGLFLGIVLLLLIEYINDFNHRACFMFKIPMLEIRCCTNLSLFYFMFLSICLWTFKIIHIIMYQIVARNAISSWSISSSCIEKTWYKMIVLELSVDLHTLEIMASESIFSHKLLHARWLTFMGFPIHSTIWLQSQLFYTIAPNCACPCR